VGNFTVAFYYGGTKISTEKAGPLTAGNQTQVEVDWRAVKGTHDMKAVADPDNKLAEVSEDDNSMTVSLTVKEKPGGADNNVLMVIAAVVVIAVVAVAALWMLRARKAKSQ
jgi:subtilase family serine protease